jgi:hypothetical protein
MSAPRCCRRSSRPARSRSQRFCSAVTRALRLLISSAIVPAESATYGLRTIEQTTASHAKVIRWFGDKPSTWVRKPTVSLAAEPPVRPKCGKSLVTECLGGLNSYRAACRYRYSEENDENEQSDCHEISKGIGWTQA